MTGGRMMQDMAWEKLTVNSNNILQLQHLSKTSRWCLYSMRVGRTILWRWMDNKESNTPSILPKSIPIIWSSICHDTAANQNASQNIFLLLVATFMNMHGNFSIINILSFLILFIPSQIRFPSNESEYDGVALPNTTALSCPSVSLKYITGRARSVSNTGLLRKL